MRITLMCAVPATQIDGGPYCTDGRGGQIYHGATPGIFVRCPSRFSVGVAVSFLLEYEPDEVEVSHLEYVEVTARMLGDVVGTTRTEFALKPYGPLPCRSIPKRRATYENIPLLVECSCADLGLIELSWSLKLDTLEEPVEADQCSFVRSFNLLDVEEKLSPEQYDSWQIEQIATRRKRIRRNSEPEWKRMLRRYVRWV